MPKKLLTHGLRNELEASEQEQKRLKNRKEIAINIEGVLGRTELEGRSRNHQGGMGLQSSLGGI